MRKLIMPAIALLVSACARPTVSFEEPPLVRTGANETLSVAVTEDFELGVQAIDQFTQTEEIFLVGELSPRLNPLRGSGTLLIVATEGRASWFFRPIVARDEWNLYPASVEYTQLHIRAFVRWVLVCNTMLEPTQSMMMTREANGILPAHLIVREPQEDAEIKGEVHVHLFTIN